jgi:hypothetical protein
MSAELPVILKSPTFLAGRVETHTFQPAALLPHIPIPNKNDNRVTSPGSAVALFAAERLVLASIGNRNCPCFGLIGQPPKFNAKI